MNVLLINTNQFRPPVLPIGILCVATYLRQKGLDVEVLDLCFEDNIEEITIAYMEKYKPDLVGVGIRNIDNILCTQSEWFLPSVSETVKLIKSISKVPIVVGGAGFSIFPERIVEMLEMDYGIVGEGEKSFYLLTKALNNEFELENIPGLVYRDKAGILQSNTVENMTTDELNELENVDLSFVDSEKYYNVGGVCSLQTKRGCGLGCIFCTYPVIEGKCFRLRKVSKIIEEIKYRVEINNMTYFYFVDSILNIPWKHMDSLCDEIIKNKLDIKWFSYVSPEGFTEKRLKNMMDSGCDGIWFSVDTCSAEMLVNMEKGYDINTIENAINICRENNIKYNLVLLLGGPGETNDTLNETFDFLEKYDPNLAVILYGLRIYPGTKLYDIALSEGIITNDTDLLKPIFYISDKVKDTIIDTIKFRCVDHPNWYATPETWSRQDKIKNILLEKKVEDLYKSGERGPFWAIVDKIKRGEK